MTTKVDMTALEIAEAYEGCAKPEFEGAHPTVRVNGEDFAAILAGFREACSQLTAEAEHAAQLRKALIAARSHIDNLHGEIGRRTYQQEELEVTTAFDGLGDGQFNGDWASIMGIIDAAMEKANG